MIHNLLDPLKGFLLLSSPSELNPLFNNLDKLLVTEANLGINLLM